MTETGRREPRFGDDAGTGPTGPGSLRAGDPPVASGAARRRGGPAIWLVPVLLAAGAWAVAHFSDIDERLLARIAGGTPERESVNLVYEIERALDRLGLEPGRVDGELDPVTVGAIRLYQESAGLPVDGEPSRALLEDMRAVAAELDRE